MTPTQYRTSLVVGAGTGLSASIERRLARSGMSVALAARHTGQLEGLCTEIGATAYACDTQDPAQVARLFDAVERDAGPPDVLVYNASARVRGPFTRLDAEEVRRTLLVSAFGGFLAAQRALPAMLKQGFGAMLFTGASASVKGYAESAPFAMGKFALRGLAQSLAREVAPKGIHVAHFVIDGAIRRDGVVDEAHSTLDPDAIADTYLHVLMKPRSAWTWEVEMRPWVERF
jgi:NAD(P)-dependent dehydrogenase (short-subunit alcohol dehydrogenase family)